VHCDRDDSKCVKKAIEASTSDYIWICWEHSALTDILKELGFSKAPTYPSDRYDLIWTV